MSAAEPGAPASGAEVQGALSGVRVVELGHGITGPFATRLLGDLGADVIKVERPGCGDFARGIAPIVGDGAELRSMLFEWLNWNKRSLELDLGDEHARDVVRLLAEQADIVIESFRPGRLARWGIGPDVLRTWNSRLAVVSVSNFGQEGPYADYRASDLVFQAMGGILQISGTSDREPLKAGLRQSAYYASFTVAYAGIAALLSAIRTGTGAHVDVSILECVASQLVMNEAYYAYLGVVQGRQPAVHDPLAGDPIPCADGHVALQTTGNIGMGHLAEFFGDPSLAEPKFSSTELRTLHAAELTARLAEHLRYTTGRAYFTRASQRGIPSGFVQGARELLECPQLEARDVYETDRRNPSAREGGWKMPARFVRFSRTPVTMRCHAPRLGEHTREILAELRTAERPSSPPPLASESSSAIGHGAPGPLSGLRVLDLSYVWAVPYIGGLLSDLGAEVIKVEAPHRLDQTRGYWGPLVDNDPGTAFWDRGIAFQVVNRGKRALSLDLSSERGREILIELVRGCDVLLESFTPRVMTGWGMTFESLSAFNPRLVMLSNTGYGSTGPWAPFKAQGTTLEATLGSTRFSGYPGGKPTKVGQSYPDFLACWAGLTALMAALVHRERDGHGQWIDLGMYQVGTFVMPEALLHYQAEGTELPRRGNEDLDVLISGVFRARGEDRWLAISVPDRAALRTLEGVIAGVTGSGDAEPSSGAEEAIAVWCRDRDAGEAAAVLQAAGIAAGPVNDAHTLLTDPHLRGRGFYERVDAGEASVGSRWVIGRPYTWTSHSTSVSTQGPAPAFGQDNISLLREIGIDDGEIESLGASGISTPVPVDPREPKPFDLEMMLAAGTLVRIDHEYRCVLDELGGGPERLRQSTQQSTQQREPP